MNELTWNEIKELYDEHYNGYHIWIRMMALGDVLPAIITEHPELGIVAVWCAGKENSFLTEDMYNTIWVAYFCEYKEI